ncbi:MAG: response regulator [Planctomycetes bacterium]|nr:response regulator [Planctomycetota bacterium]
MTASRATGAASARELARLRRAQETGALHALQVHHEELQTQNEQLIASQQALEESRLRYVELFDLAPVGYATLSSVGTIEEANLALARLLGHERRTLVRRSLRTFVAAAHRRSFLAHLVDCRSGEAMHRVDVELLSADGTRIPVRLTTRAIASRSLWMVITDQREQVSLRAERRRGELREATAAATLDAKDRFLAILSHELRTPLTPILAAVTTLAELPELPPALRPLLEVVRRNVRIEARLIDDLLDMTRLEHQKLGLEVESVDLHEMAREVQREPGESPSAAHPIGLDLQATVHHVAADRMRLRQVLWNLLGNARRYSPDGGAITIRTRDREAGRLELAIEDHGVGIEPDFLANVFEPFAQATHPRKGARGLGLGLAICRGIVVAHGGEIAVQSDGLGSGTRVVLRWPTAARGKALAPSVAAPASALVPATRALRIVLVEDDEDCAMALAFLLRHAGHAVVVAASCAEARAACATPPDLLISDLDLPDGNGGELLRELLRAGPLVAVALSGFGSAEDHRRSRAAGFAAHLVKPIERAPLLAAIARATAPAGTDEAIDATSG